VIDEHAKEIMNLYFNYIDSLPTEFKSSFMSIGWRNLSSGENSILDLYSRIAYALSHKLPAKENKENKKIDTIYLMIDEGETGFHPHWQKQYLHYLLEFIYYRFAGYKVQLFISSHSPFIVSDLPKNNLIFLHREGRYSKVYDFKEQTFAGNIHTLFADQFFIKDGVKGQFAQHALDHYLRPFITHQNPDSTETIQNFIQLIGEPILKHKLEEILLLRSNQDV